MSARKRPGPHGSLCPTCGIYLTMRDRKQIAAALDHIAAHNGGAR